MEVTKEAHYFWFILEEISGGFPIPSHVKNILNINGFSSMSFQDINDEVIFRVEKFVQSEMLEILQATSQSKGSVFDDKDKVHFFGQYAIDPSKFRFMIGELFLIRRLVKNFQDILSDNTKSKPFQVPCDYTISSKDTVRLAFGTYFGHCQVVENSPNQTLNITPSEKEDSPMQVNQTAENKVNSPNQRQSITPNESKNRETPMNVNDTVPNIGPESNQNTNDSSMAKLKQKLFEIVESYNRLIEAPRLRPFSVDTIRIKTNNGKHSAEITCVFCDTSGVYTVQTFKPSKAKSYYWTCANFKKHLFSQHSKSEANGEVTTGKKRKSVGAVKNSAKKLKSSDDSQEVLDSTAESSNDKSNSKDITPTDENKEELRKQATQQNSLDRPSRKAQKKNTKELKNDDGSDITIDNTVASLNSNQDVADNELLRDQIVQQLHLVFEAVTAENVKILNMKIQTSPPQMKFIQVIKIKDDGNCLFGAMAHQLFHCTQSDISERSSELRAEVVTHIQKNFKRYSHAIKGRIYEQQDSIGSPEKLKPAQVNKLCKSFLSNYLSKSGYYGGHESLTAVSEIYTVNIIVFREKDTFSLVNGFNRSYDRTLCLAYRLRNNVPKGQEKMLNPYNHYDSVCGIKENIL